MCHFSSQDLLRCWVKDHPVGKKWLQDGSAAKAILDKPPKVEASFEKHDDANPESRRRGLVRWQTKPERDWGPKARAKLGKVETLEERRLKGVKKSQERREKRKLVGLANWKNVLLFVCEFYGMAVFEISR